MQRIALGLLAVAVLGEGVYLVKLQRAVSRLSDGVGAPAASAPAPEGGTVRPDPARPAYSPPSAPRGSVPVFSASATPAAVMDTIASPEGRQKLQEVLTAMKEQRRKDKMIKSAERRHRLDQKMQEIVTGELALNAEEGRKTRDVLARVAATRKHAIEELQSGLKTRADAKSEVDTATRAADDQLKEILGDKRLLAYRELRRKTDRALTAAAP
jgi:hypothetical protein